MVKLDPIPSAANVASKGEKATRKPHHQKRHPLLTPKFEGRCAEPAGHMFNVSVRVE